MDNIPGNLTSLWLETTPKTNYPSLEKNVETDVCIVGGGIVGITTAFLLADAVREVTLIDWARIITGVTGHTTAKVTSLHGLIYHQLANNLSFEKAKQHIEANEKAINFVENLSKKLNIQCDFIRTQAFTFAEDREDVDFVKKEVEILKKFGLDASFEDKIPLNIQSYGSVRLSSQGQFHPRKYLLGLVKNMKKVKIYENTKAIGFEEGEPNIIKTEKAIIKAKDIVLATQMPFFKIPGAYFSKLYQFHSYVLAIHIADQIPEGIFYGTRSHTIRNQSYKEGAVLLVGGEGHKVGQGGDIKQRYLNLVEFYNKVFRIKKFEFYWSAQDPDTPDGLPYIGQISDDSKHIFFASGFHGWGMTNGTVSAKLISDMILGIDNPLKELYNPSRKDWGAIAGRFIRENANVVGKFAESKIHRQKEIDLKKIKAGEGVVGKIDGETVGVYKDEKGKIYAISPFCSFEGCELSWNNAEKTWDCPCCGSRFSYDGTPFLGPATKNLKRINV